MSKLPSYDQSSITYRQAINVIRMTAFSSGWRLARLLLRDIRAGHRRTIILAGRVYYMYYRSDRRYELLAADCLAK